MGKHGYPLNSTNIMNNTYFDLFCTDMLVGPLVLGIFSVPVACVGFSASVWLLWVLIQRQRNGSSNNIYMLNLTIMDLVFNLLVIPNVLNYFVWHDTIFFYTAVFFFCFNMCGRPLFMSCICVDCYMAVVLPITYMKIKNGRYRMVTCALVWGFTLAFGCTYIVLDSPLVTLASLGLSAPIIVFCNLSIICALRKPDPSGRSHIHPQKQRARQTILHSLVTTFLSYFPVMIVLVLFYQTKLSKHELICMAIFPCFMFTAFASTILPLLYLWNLGCLKDIRLICGRNE